MIGKILEKTRGRPCSCPTGKICTACKSKKVIPPQVIVEEPRRLPAPVSITYYKPPNTRYETNPTVHYVEKPKRWKIYKKKKYESQPSGSPLCRWYKRRKALKELIKEHEKEKEIERRRKREEFEKERLKDFIDWEQAKQRTQSSPPKKVTPILRKKGKERYASVKPKAQSKYVVVKKVDRRDTITDRFVNYCYRFCCQLYCCLTCIMLVIFTVICIV